MYDAVPSTLPVEVRPVESPISLAMPKSVRKKSPTPSMRMLLG
jgi:hypothetical protein